jgi:hypothetical protein
MDFARRQRSDIAEIEQECPPLKQRLDVDGRIAEPPVDETRVQEGPHIDLPTGTLRAYPHRS